MVSRSWSKIAIFILVAEGFATLFALIPFILIMSEQRQDPTNIKYVVDFFRIIPYFLIGQIPGIIISTVIHAYYGRKSFRW